MIPPLSFTIRREQYTFSSPAEEAESRRLTFLQKQHLENLLSVCVDEKLGLAPEDGKNEEFRLRHEFLRGQLTILHYILALAAATEE